MPAIEIAAALAKMSRGGLPLLLSKGPPETPPPEVVPAPSPERKADTPPPRRTDGPTRSRAVGPFQTFRVEVGSQHGVKPGNLMGAIANEAGLDARQIGRIHVAERHSLVELPEGLPQRLVKLLQKVRVGGQMLKLHATDPMPARPRRPSGSARNPH